MQVSPFCSVQTHSFEVKAADLLRAERGLGCSLTLESEADPLSTKAQRNLN